MQRRKQELRRLVQRAREQQPERGSISGTIRGRLTALPEFVEAETVMFYVDFDAEVQTRPLLEELLADEKRVVVPYCVGLDIRLFRLRSLDELALGMWGILEPKEELRGREDRRVGPAELDLMVMPGVAFDRRGGRLGHGKGYFDRLLQHVRVDTALVALAFECQLVDEVPMMPYDVFMDKVVTEKTIYAGKRGQEVPQSETHPTPSNPA